jgi:hypothetical protein
MTTRRVDAQLDQKDVILRKQRLESLLKDVSTQFLTLEGLADNALFSDTKHAMHLILDEAFLRIRKLLILDKDRIL